MEMEPVSNSPPYFTSDQPTSPQSKSSSSLNVASRVKALEAANAGESSSSLVSDGHASLGASSSRTLLGSSRSLSNQFSLPTGTPADSKTREHWHFRLLHSEQAYLAQLEILRDAYVKPLREDSRLAKPLIMSSKADHTKLGSFFINVETIVSLNSQFLTDLIERGIQRVGGVLEQYAPLFRMYAQYVGDYLSFIETLKAQASDPTSKFSIWAKSCEEKLGAKSKSIWELMVLPRDRIKLYQMHVEMLIKYTQPTPGNADEEKDYQSLLGAQKEFDATSGAVDLELNATTNHDRHIRVQREWVGVTFFPEVVPGQILASSPRIFLMEGKLEKVSRRSQTSVHFVLFNDLLAYGEAIETGALAQVRNAVGLLAQGATSLLSGGGGGGSSSSLNAGDGSSSSLNASRAGGDGKDPTTVPRYRHRRSFELLSMAVERAESVEGRRDPRALRAVRALDHTAFPAPSPLQGSDLSPEATRESSSFYILTPTKSFKVYALSPADATRWITELNRAISVARSSAGVAAPHFEEMRPVWVPDYLSKGCMRCGLTFNLMRRRHHCRRCGMLVCQPCSRQRLTTRVPVKPDDPGGKTKEAKVRVCDACARRRPSVRFSVTPIGAPVTTGSGRLSHVTKPPSPLAQLDVLAVPHVAGSNSPLRRISDAKRPGSTGTSGSSLPSPVENLTPTLPSQRRSLLNDSSDGSDAEELDETSSAATSSRALLVSTTSDRRSNSDRSSAGERGSGGGGRRGSAEGLLPPRARRASSSVSSQGGATTTTRQPPLVSSLHAIRAVCVQAFVPADSESPQDPDVLTDVEVGDVISVEEITEGCATGTNERTGEYGFVAAALLRMLDEQGNPTDAALPESYDGQLTHAPQISPASASGLSMHSDRRSKVMSEIISTERTYVQNLKTLLLVFVRPLIADYRAGANKIGGSVCGVVDEISGEGGAPVFVFLTRLEHFLTLNGQLLSRLENRAKSWDPDATTVGDLFQEFAPHLKIYDEYSSGYEFATKSLSNRKTSDSKLHKFLEEQSKQHSHGQTLFSLLITPVQRVPRYLLLLRELLKNTEETHPDWPLVKHAEESIQGVALHINESIRERERAVATRELDQEYAAEKFLEGSPNRNLVLRGDLEKQSRKKNHNCHFILFTDLLVYHHRGGTGRSKPPRRIDLSLSCMVREVKEDDRAFDVQSESKSFRVIAPNAEQKKKWFTAIDECIKSTQSNRKRGGSNPPSAQDARKLGRPAALMGRSPMIGLPGLVSSAASTEEVLAPVWQQDTAACQICNQSFSLLLRRHHCRVCGKCICDADSRHRLLVDHVDPKNEVRVCNECYEIRNDQSKFEDIVQRGKLKQLNQLNSSGTKLLGSSPKSAASKESDRQRRGSSPLSSSPFNIVGRMGLNHSSSGDQLNQLKLAAASIVPPPASGTASGSSSPASSKFGGGKMFPLANSLYSRGGSQANSTTNDSNATPEHSPSRQFSPMMGAGGGGSPLNPFGDIGNSVAALAAARNQRVAKARAEVKAATDPELLSLDHEELKALIVAHGGDVPGSRSSTPPSLEELRAKALSLLPAPSAPSTVPMVRRHSGVKPPPLPKRQPPVAAAPVPEDAPTEAALPEDASSRSLWGAVEDAAVTLHAESFIDELGVSERTLPVYTSTDDEEDEEEANEEEEVQANEEEEQQANEEEEQANAIEEEEASAALEEERVVEERPIPPPPPRRPSQAPEPPPRPVVASLVESEDSDDDMDIL